MGLSRTRHRHAAKAIAVMLVFVAGLSAAAATSQTKPFQLLAQADAPNISGNWFDASLSTSTITIVQNGSEISYTATAVAEDPPFAGMTVDVSGTGHLIGNALDSNFSFHFQNGVSSTGHCSGILRKPDVIAWHCRDNNNFVNRPVWIR
jgi:hypothetical protein